MKNSMKELSLLMLALCLSLSIGSALAAPVAPVENPEFRLVEGLMAASGDEMGSVQARQVYQQKIESLLQGYISDHTGDPRAAMQNLMTAFQVMGISEHEVAQLKGLSERYAPVFAANTDMTTAESEALWSRYGQDMTKTLQSIPYPQGAEFSACQWSVAIMGVGLAVGIPLTAYSLGKAMGDQSVSGWISNTGALFFLAGLGGLIATIPTCLF